jgi:hypothetical protein
MTQSQRIVCVCIQWNMCLDECMPRSEYRYCPDAEGSTLPIVWDKVCVRFATAGGVLCVLLAGES